VVIVAVPHSSYASLQIPKKTEVIDLWGITKKKNSL